MPKRSRAADTKETDKLPIHSSTETKGESPVPMDGVTITNKTPNRKNPYGVFKKPDLVLIASDRGIARANERKVPELRKLLAEQGKPFPSQHDIARLRGASPLPADAPGLGLGATPPADADEEFAKSISRADSAKPVIDIGSDDDSASESDSESTEDEDDEVKVILDKPATQPSNAAEGDQKIHVTDRDHFSAAVTTEPVKPKRYFARSNALFLRQAVQKPIASLPDQPQPDGALQLLQEMQRDALKRTPVSPVKTKFPTAVCAHCHSVYDKRFVQCPGCKVRNPAVAARKYCTNLDCNYECADENAQFCGQCGTPTDAMPLQFGPGPSGTQRASMLSKSNQRALTEGKFVEMDAFLPSVSGHNPAAVSHSMHLRDDGAITITAAASAPARKVTDVQSWYEAAFSYHRELSYLEPKERADDFHAFMFDAGVMIRTFGWQCFAVYDKLVRLERQGTWPACRLMPRSIELAMQAWSLHPSSSVIPSAHTRSPHSSAIPRMSTGNRSVPSAFNPSHNSGARIEICRNHNNNRCTRERCSRMHVCLAPECMSKDHVLKDCSTISPVRKSTLMDQLAQASSTSSAARSA